MRKMPEVTRRAVAAQFRFDGLDAMAREALRIAGVKKQVVSEENVMSALMFAVTELSEAARAWRDGNKADFGLELGDAVIMIGHIAAAMGVDLAGVVQMGMLKNSKRPVHHGHVRSLGKNLKD